MLSYAPALPSDAKAGAGRPMTSRLEPAAIYKRMVIALRSLFSYVRVLPTYSLFKDCAVRSVSLSRQTSRHASYRRLLTVALLLPRFPPLDLINFSVHLCILVSAGACQA